MDPVFSWGNTPLVAVDLEIHDLIETEKGPQRRADHAHRLREIHLLRRHRGPRQHPHRQVLRREARQSLLRRRRVHRRDREPLPLSHPLGLPPQPRTCPTTTSWASTSPPAATSPRLLHLRRKEDLCHLNLDRYLCVGFRSGSGPATPSSLLESLAPPLPAVTALSSTPPAMSSPGSPSAVSFGQGFLPTQPIFLCCLISLSTTLVMSSSASQRRPLICSFFFPQDLPMLYKPSGKKRWEKIKQAKDSFISLIWLTMVVV
ncbi:hypothetical protein Tsubulata_001400 [Turnera subulata]|uniref:Uncharacterized protein n=1 Tax=Turnera subulata TaxID=218843 RepID=A0A9Q0FJL0_9ROSI|nr:hypothetical protein Tsubulata_001400 [Turnera subulata]